MIKKKVLYVFLSMMMLSSCTRERTLLIVGSSCMGRFTEALSRSWGGDSEVQLGGTSLGLLALLQGRADIAACSREVSDADGDVVAVEVAYDTIVAAVNRNNPIDDLTVEQLTMIYTGEITNWSEIGGCDAPIVVIGRESGSGTRASFENTLGISDAVHGQELPESGMIRTAVSSLDNAIGYFSLCDADESIKLMSIDGIYPTAENVCGGKYFLTRPFVFCYRKGDNRRSVMDFISYAQSPKGQSIAKELGLLPVEVFD